MALRTRQKEAFTLLELLVAMVLMVVAASCLYTALYTGFRAYRSASSAIEPTSLAINAIELLKRDLSGVLPPGGTLAGAFTGTDSAGLKGVDTDSVAFYTTHIYADDEQLAGGLGKIELVLEEDVDNDDGTYQLVRCVTMNLLPLKDVEPDEQILCRNVVSLNLRYYDGDGWIDDWDSTADANSLPLAVEIDIQIAHNGKHNRDQEPEKRRLIQSFAIMCETPAEAESESAL